MKELVETIVVKLDAFKEETNKLTEKGNKAAGTRARKLSLELEKLLKEFRKESVEASR